MGDVIELTPDKRRPNKAAKLEGAKKAASLIRGADEDELLSMVIYARNKVGKTSFCGSSDLPTLIIDCGEHGTASVRKRKNVKVYRVDYWEELDWIYWYLKAGDHPFKVVAIDTVTMLATICMKFVLGDEASRDGSRDPAMPDKRHWGKVGELMKTQFINFRNLKGLEALIFTAQEKRTTEEDEEGGTVSEVHPELSPSPRSTLLGAVGIIGRLYVKEITDEKTGKTKAERRMLLSSHPLYVAGNRFSTELKAIERNPNLGDFLRRIKGESSADADI